MHIFWSTLSAFGDSRFLLPLALLTLAAVPASSTTLRRRWAVAIAGVTLLTLASKLAYMGWGMGVDRLDFTGFSGHAALSAMVYPVLFAATLQPRLPCRWKWTWTAAGIGFAALIATSRLPLHAHSIAEVVAGFLLGSVASAWVLREWRSAEKIPAARLAIAVAVAVAVPVAMDDVRSHDLIEKLAMSLSDRESVVRRHHR